MSIRSFAITGLLIYHGLLATLFLMWGRVLPTTHWTGSFVAFGLPTIQFTWSYTVGFIVGPSRRLRHLYGVTLLSSLFPLYFLGVMCWITYHFLGLYIAALLLMVCLVGLGMETYAGILFGNEAHSRSRNR